MGSKRIFAAILLAAWLCGLARAAEIPRSRIGVQVVMGGSNQNVALRSTALLNPFARPDERFPGWGPFDRWFDAVCTTWPELFARRIDPLRQWVEGNEGKRSAIVDVHRAFGVSGEARRVFSVDGPLTAREYGADYLVDGFAQSARNYTDAGIEVVAHLGRPNSDGWADRELKAGNRYKVYAALHEIHGPLIEAGCRIGFDNQADAKTDSFDAAYYRYLKALGVPLQIEGTPSSDAPHWKGETVWLEWQLFNRCHVQQDSAHGRIYPKFGTPAFDAAYPEVRISVDGYSFNAPSNGSQRHHDTAARKAWLKHIRDGVKDTLRKSPNVRCLLHHYLIEESIIHGVPVEDWLP